MLSIPCPIHLNLYFIPKSPVMQELFPKSKAGAMSAGPCFYSFSADAGASIRMRSIFSVMLSIMPEEAKSLA